MEEIKGCVGVYRFQQKQAVILCGPIKHNESDVGNSDFLIHPIIVCNSFCKFEMKTHTFMQIMVRLFVLISCIDMVFSISENSMYPLNINI